MKIYPANTQTCVLKFCLFDKFSIRTCVFAHMLLRPHVVIPGDKSAYAKLVPHEMSFPLLS